MVTTKIKYASQFLMLVLMSACTASKPTTGSTLNPAGSGNPNPPMTRTSDPVQCGLVTAMSSKIRSNAEEVIKFGCEQKRNLNLVYKCFIEKDGVESESACDSNSQHKLSALQSGVYSFWVQATDPDGHSDQTHA